MFRAVNKFVLRSYTSAPMKTIRHIAKQVDKAPYKVSPQLLASTGLGIVFGLMGYLAAMRNHVADENLELLRKLEYQRDHIHQHEERTNVENPSEQSI